MLSWESRLFTDGFVRVLGVYIDGRSNSYRHFFEAHDRILVEYDIRSPMGSKMR